MENQIVNMKKVLIENNIYSQEQINKVSNTTVSKHYHTYKTIVDRRNKRGKSLLDTKITRRMITDETNRQSGFQVAVARIQSGTIKTKVNMMVITTKGGQTVRMKKDKKVFELLRQAKLSDTQVNLSVKYDPTDISSYFGWYQGVK